MDIYIINNRKFNFYNYKPKAFNQARLLFLKYGDLSNELLVLKQQILTDYYNSNIGKLIKSYMKRDIVLTRMGEIEDELITIDDNFWNHKGFYKKKIWYSLKAFFLSEWCYLTCGLALIATFVFSIVYAESLPKTVAQLFRLFPV